MPRMVVVWCPDWPVAAAGAPPDSLTAVVHANRVVACPGAPRVEVLQPGECAFPARGAARYHGGEPALAVTVTAAVHAAVAGRGGPGDRRGGPPVDRGGPGDRRGGPPVDRGGPGDCRGGPPEGRASRRPRPASRRRAGRAGRRRPA